MGFLTSSDGSYLKTSDGSYIATSDTSLLTITCITYAATVGTAYSSSYGKTGTTPWSFTIISGSLPPGLSLNAVSGAITGTPTTVGTYTFDVFVEDSLGAQQIQQCQILVTSAQVVGSGVYKLVVAQTHETLYTSVANPDSPTTANSAIPNPFFETALIGDDE